MFYFGYIFITPLYKIFSGAYGQVKTEALFGSIGTLIGTLASKIEVIKMSKKAVEKLFESLYRLSDLRWIFRETSPLHELNEDQEKRARKILEEVRECLDDIEEEI